MKTVGILALQGDFHAHSRAAREAGAETIEVRTAAQLDRCDGLIIPGGESTTMLRLLNVEQMLAPLHCFGLRKPIYGTCAGAILLACEVLSPAQPSLALMDVTVERNAYGRQVDSRITRISCEAPGVDADLEAVFIRAPIIRRVGEGVRVLATYRGDPVWAEQGRHMVTTFHPELTADPAVHRHFVEKL